MMSFEGKFLAMSVCVRSEPLGFISRARGTEFSDARINSYSMLGVIPSTTIKGWLRSGMNKFLIANGINGLHPLPENTISQNNKKRYQKDLATGYLPRDNEGTEDHIITRLFGSLGKLGNLRVNNVYFYPREANGKFKNLQAVFNGRIGQGRVDVQRKSPTEQGTTVEKYMTSEFLQFHAVEAPLSIGFFRNDPVMEAFTAVTIDYINRHNAECDPRYLMGGQRGFGSGEVVIRLVDNFKSTDNSTGLSKDVFAAHVELVNRELASWKETFPLEMATTGDNGKKGSNSTRGKGVAKNSRKNNRGKKNDK